MNTSPVHDCIVGSGGFPTSRADQEFAAAVALDTVSVALLAALPGRRTLLAPHLWEIDRSVGMRRKAAAT